MKASYSSKKGVARNLLFFLLLFFMLPSMAIAQSTVRGIVTDDNGEPLPGVAVVKDGTSLAVSTDIDGRFAIKASEGDVLKFSYVGMESKTVKVGKENGLNVKLSSSLTELDEVVVVGYGTQKKVNLTGAVQSVSGQDLIRKSTSNLSTALQGIVPGLSAVQSSGQPGADNASIEIRGIGSLNSSTSPLVLIDGAEGDMNRIDMNTVESISILKDAASASIYGSRASNGVILITTKRGAEGKVKVNYNGYAGFSTPTYLPGPVSAIEYMTQMDKAYVNNGQDPVYKDIIEIYKTQGADNYNYYDTDWKDLVLKDSGFQQSHSVSVSGGTKLLNVFANAGYYYQNGIIPNNSFSRATLRLNTDMQVRKWLKVGVDAHIRQATAIRPSQDSAAGIIGSILTMTPITSALNDDGTYGYGRTGYNPLAIVNDGGTRKDVAPEVTFRAFAELTPLEGLYLKADYTRRQVNSEGSVFIRPYDTYEGGRFMMTYPSTSNNGTRQEERTKTVNQQFIAQASYEKTIERNYFKVMGVFQAEKLDYNYLLASRQNFQYDGYEDLMHGDATTAGNSSNRYELAQLSYVYRVNYSYDNRYLIELNGRYDGTSRFRPESRWGFFPSASAGWRISEESFFEPAKTVVDDMKLRVSYGTMGNQSIGSYYPYVAAVNSLSGTVNYWFDKNLTTGIAQAQLANELITWEKSKQFDVGLDLTLFKSRLSLTADYYIRNISGMLQQFDLPDFVGMSAPWQNAGSMRNNGWEVSIGWQDKIGDLSYYVKANLSDVKNTVTNLYGKEYDSSPTITREGEALGSYYGYVADGYFQSQEEIDMADCVGMSAPWQNAGSMRNNGWEVSIGWQDKIGDLSYYVKANLSDVKNTVTNLYGKEYDSSPTITREGEALGSYYGYVADGYFQSQEEIDMADCVYGGNKANIKPGYIRYVDVNHDGEINSKDRVILGNSTPRYEYSFTLGGQWKGIDLSLFFQGVGKRDLYYSGAGARPLVQNSTIFKSQLDTWSPENPDAEYPLLLVDAGSTNMNNIVSSFWIKSGAYLRLKNLTVGYTLPKKWTNRVSIDNLRLYFTASNLFTINSGYKGYDPETGVTSGAMYPVMKTFNFGINLDF